MENGRFRVMITGGGTGGHVYPGLAVAQALRCLDPGVEIRFVGTRRGIESVLVPNAGFELDFVPASGFRGMSPISRLRFLVNLLLGIIVSFKLILGFRPHVILGTGGFVSLPVLIAGRMLGRRLALQEQNSVPGSTNRLLSRWCRRIYLGFEEAAPWFRGRDTLWTGNPVRAEFREALQKHGRRIPGGGDVLHLLVFGGSRGAATLNRAMIEAVDYWRERQDLELIIQTGIADNTDVRSAWENSGVRDVRVEKFINNMPDVLAWADLVVSRAGAMTLAELACAGRPAVLVPFPHATDDHQTANARGLVNAGAARLLPDADCNGLTLTAAVDALIAERGQLGIMSDAAGRFCDRDAAALIAADLMRLAGLLPPHE